jgi:hypothetical protein
MKTFKAIVTLEGRNFVFIGNRRVYGGEEIEVTDSQFSEKTMKKVAKEQTKKTSSVKPKQGLI